MPSTKIEMNHNRIARIQGLDELAALLFPGNKTHQKVFLAVFIDAFFIVNDKNGSSDHRVNPHKETWSPKRYLLGLVKISRSGVHLESDIMRMPMLFQPTLHPLAEPRSRDPVFCSCSDRSSLCKSGGT